MTQRQHKHFYLPAWIRCSKANGWRMAKGRLAVSNPLQPEISSSARLAPPETLPELLQVWDAAGQIAARWHSGINVEHLRHACHVVAIGRGKSSLDLTNSEVNLIVALMDVLADPLDLSARRRWEFPEEVSREDTIAHCRRLAPEGYIRAIAGRMFDVRELDDLTLGQAQSVRRKLFERQGKGALAGAALDEAKTEKEQYLERIAHLKSEGLRDVKFYGANTFGVTEEEAYAELNRLHAAPDLPDPEVLGKYSKDQGFPVTPVTPEIIKLKRELLLTKRLCRKLKTSTT